MQSAACVAGLLAASAVVTCCTANEEGRPARRGQPALAVAPATAALYRDTQRVNQQPLIAAYSKALGGHVVSLTTLSGDTVVNYAPYYFQHEYLDINADGALDIRMHVFSNTPNQCENYFYNRATRRYHKINDSDLDIEKLPGTSLYYSSNRLGCASMNWASTLSRIDNWQEIPIGYVEVDSCGADTEGISIYKVQANNQVLITTLPIQELVRFKGTAHFFNSYWQRNYTRFQ